MDFGFEKFEEVWGSGEDRYTPWIYEFESKATPEAGYPLEMDIDYNIVDDMFSENLSVDYAIHEYFNRSNG